MTAILDPTATRADDITAAGPAAGALAGKTLGIRVDIMWRAWDWVSEVWADEFRRAGAKVVFWRAHQGRFDGEGERLDRELRAFVASVDVAIVGLGNCGSCTGWTVHDALVAAAAGLPVTAVVTQNFEQLGRDLARRGGRSGLRFHVLPYPLNEQLEDDVRAIARDHLAGMLQTMGATIDQSRTEAA